MDIEYVLVWLLIQASWIYGVYDGFKKMSDARKK